MSTFSLNAQSRVHISWFLCDLKGDNIKGRDPMNAVASSVYRHSQPINQEIVHPDPAWRSY
jgi:hypothetical protein